MAERYLKKLCPGWTVKSAGIRVLHSGPATKHAVQAASELGLDLADHKSQSVGELEGEQFDRVFTMGPEHLLGLPWKARLLSSLRDEAVAVNDPFGGDMESYREALRQIRYYLDVFDGEPRAVDREKERNA